MQHETAEHHIEAGAPQDEVKRLLIQAGEKLPHDVRARVLGRPDPVPALIAVLTDPILYRADGPGEGMAPVHAARLLGELKDIAAVGPLLDTLKRTDDLDLLHCDIIAALKTIGTTVLEPALHAYTENEDKGYRKALGDVLSQLKVHDPRVRDILVRLLEDNPDRGAMNLAEYGDPATLPDLHRAFDRFQAPDSASFLGTQTLIELRAAIEELGGDLTSAQKEKYRQVDEPRRRWAKQINQALARSKPPAPVPSKPGRNDPCPCGSGKKYKKCHLGQWPSA